MSKKTRTVSNKAGKLMKCDGQMLKKVVEAKGYKLHELSKMLRYCSDYLTTCCRTNKISDVAAKYLMDYKIFPQMYYLEGEIKVDDIVSPTEVKIDKDDNKTIADLLDAPLMRDVAISQAAEELKAETDKEVADWLNRNAIYGIPKTDDEIEFGTPYGIVRSEKDLRNCIKQAIGPKSPNWGTNLITVRDMLENACFNGMSYNVEDMRNDLLAFAANVDKYPEKWVEFVNRLSLKYEPDCSHSPFSPTAQEIKKVLNEKYGTLKLAKGVDYGYGPSPKYPSYVNASQKIAKGLFQLMQVAIKDLKYNPEFKELIKQAVKEAFEEV